MHIQFCSTTEEHLVCSSTFTHRRESGTERAEVVGVVQTGSLTQEPTLDWKC